MTFAVLLAGGRGSRLWPLSTEAVPKQLLALDGADSLLRQAFLRILPLVPAERVLVVTAADLADAVRAELPELPSANVLVEPSARGTAPAIAWAAAIATRRGGEALIALPADHRIVDEAGFRAALAGAVAAGADVALLGMRPTAPSTEYGYILGGAVAGSVEAFEEKPHLARAEALAARPNTWWNAGVAVLALPNAALGAHLPATVGAIDAFQAGDEATWLLTDAISFDRGVLERASGVRVVACDVGWSDLGGFEALAATWPVVDGGRGIAARVDAIDASGCTVYAPGRVVRLVGVEDLLIIEANGALLIARR